MFYGRLYRCSSHPRLEFQSSRACSAVGKPLLVSGTAGGVAKVWDYQSVACVASLEAHGSPLAAVKFHPELPIILTGCVPHCLLLS